MQPSESASGARETPGDVAELQRAVVAAIAERKKIDPASVHLDSSLVDLGIDSLDGIDLIFAFEDQYRIAIPDNVVQQMKTVRDVADALARELDKRPRSAP